MEHNLFQLKFVFGIIAIQIAFALMPDSMFFQHFADVMPSRSIESHITTDNCRVLIIPYCFVIYIHAHKTGIKWEIRFLKWSAILTEHQVPSSLKKMNKSLTSIAVDGFR